jgi:hypothetical protein
MKTRGMLVLASLVVTVPLLGCDGASRRASARLRTENAALHRQIEGLDARTRELEASLNADVTGSSPELAAIDTPQVATLSISSMSGFEPGDTPGTTVLEVHVQASDGRQRPIQLIGPLEAQILRPVPGGTPQVLADITLNPAEVRDAWRGGMFGATYLMPVLLSTSDLPSGVPLLVHVFHDDARTGRRLESTGSVAQTPSTDSP